MARTATDSYTQICWTMDNTTSPCPNTGVGGTLDMATYVGTPTYGAAGVYTNCITYSSAGTSSGNTSIGESGTALTVSLWVYLNGYVNYNLFIGKESYTRGSSWVAPHYAWALTFDSAGATNAFPRIHLTTGTGVGTPYELVGTGLKMLTGRWSHLAFTYDGALMRLYYNGLLLRSGAPGTTGAINYNAHGPYSSGCPSPGYDKLNGKVDDIRVENTVRSASYLRQLYLDTGLTFHTNRAGATYNVDSYTAIPNRARPANNYLVRNYEATPNRARSGYQDGFAAVAVKTKYKMRGYLYQDATFEEWVTTDLTGANPSGKPIRDVVIVDSFQ